MVSHLFLSGCESLHTLQGSCRVSQMCSTTVKAGNSQPGWFTCTATKCRANTCKLHFSCLWIYVLPSHFVNSETLFKPDIILSPQSAKLTACTFLVPPEELIHFQTLSPAAVWSYTKTQFPQIWLLCSAFPVAPQLEIIPVKTPRLANLTSQTLILWMLMKTWQIQTRPPCQSGWGYKAATAAPSVSACISSGIMMAPIRQRCVAAWVRHASQAHSASLCQFHSRMQSRAASQPAIQPGWTCRDVPVLCKCNR